MANVTIIGDGLIKGETIKRAVIENGLAQAEDSHLFSWYETDSKHDFQAKMLAVEREGPEAFPLDKSIKEALKEADYLICHIAPISRDLLEACQQLKMIGLCRGGTENIDLEACREKGIPVIRMVKNADATAEFTLGLILALTRQIAEGNHQLKNGHWVKQYSNDGFRKTVSELKVGIIGLGAIGQRVAKLLLSLGAEVYGYHPNMTEEKKLAVNLPINYLSLEELMTQCDVVSLHLRLTSQTNKIIDARLLGMMPSTSYLINTARAALIDETALIDSVRSKRIAGVALDVAWQEPMPADHPLLSFDNVLITPHIAGDTDVIEKAPDRLIKEMLHYQAGHSTDMLIQEKYMINQWHHQSK